MHESDLSIKDSQASARRMQAERQAVAGISTEELEAGVIEDMRRALEAIVAIAKNKADMRDRPSQLIDDLESILARSKKP